MLLETAYIKIDEQGIDLLKNYRVYQHIEYQEINQIELKRGHLITNWIIPLIIGLLIITGSIILIVNTFPIVANHNTSSLSFRNYLLIEISPCILLIGGLILTYQAFRKSVIIIISTAAKKHKIALKEFEKENKVQEVIAFLDKRTNVIKE